ncbi:MAG: primosomal protein N' [Clostridia bacterium]|nr:primosomal protein N' [Clostridia bacterium]
MFADVIVDITHEAVDKIFEYSFYDNNVLLGSRVIVPFGNKVIEGIVIKVKEKSDYSPEKIKPIYRVIENTPALIPETIELMDFVKSTCFVTRAQALRLFLPSEMRKGKVKESLTEYAFLTDSEKALKVFETLKSTAKKQKECIQFLLETGKTKLSVLNKTFGNSAVKTLINKGVISTCKEQVQRTPYKNLEFNNKTVELTKAQNDAITSIESTEKTITLLHGVTGSGKTEIYLNLIEKTIKLGKTAIMLVPEISLTPQMLRQLRARFGEIAAILHSGLSAGERFDEWWRIRNGEAKIVIGARSGIFAPIKDLGVIIIDEEHDGSYSSETSPRYNTLEVASFRAKYNNAKIILGSATPSIDSYLLANNGEYNLVTLPERINKRPLPEVEIVDMRKEVRRGNNTIFSSALKTELEETLKKGNQAIIFLNQRGYSKSVVCGECGHVIKCDSCDVSLTFHKDEDSLLCHYCGAKYKMVTACPKCGSSYLRYGGTGTERIVLDLQKLFPSARILRMDRDTTQNKESHFKILSVFSNHEADILVGTQMIAKGHDFPNVTLVGILDADQSLYFSDFRSAERTFQLLTQVSGRSGRAEDVGRVVLQTYNPDNAVLNWSIKYDYENFFKHEVSVRRATGFSPFTDIIRVLISGENEEKTLEITKKLYEDINLIYLEDKEKFRFFGCMKAPLKRLQNKFRFQILMRINAKDEVLREKIFFATEKYKLRDVSVGLEINPINLT